MSPPLLDSCLPCRRSRGHHRLVCVFPLHIIFRFPFAFDCGFSLLVIQPFVSRLLHERDGSYPYSRSPQVVYLPWVETFPLFMSLPLFVFLVCCAEKSLATVRRESVAPKEMMNSGFSFWICSRRFFGFWIVCALLS